VHAADMLTGSLEKYTWLLSFFSDSCVAKACATQLGGLHSLLLLSPVHPPLPLHMESSAAENHGLIFPGET